MPRPSRLILAPAAVAAALAWTGTAAAAITGTPDFTLAPFTKAQAGAGNAVGLTTRWAPVAFAPATGNDHYEVRVTPLPAGSPQTVSAGTATTLGPLFVGDGRPLRVEVGACQQAACDFGAGTALATHETMIDATPPAGTVVIDGGAPATDDRTVSLALDAADPLIDGRPGTSSGVSQFAVDVDDDGTYPCDPSDTSGCARGFAPAASAVLPEGDGLKTVGVTFGDGAREPSVPCATPLCAGGLGGPILGNASPPATDTILLDTVAPVARLGRVTVTVRRDDAAVFDAAASTDSSPVTPSGVNFPATTWDFADGTPVATGSRVAHAFTRIGTFVGTLRVRDRAGNVSAARSFTVTVDPRAGETIDGFGSVAGVRGSAAFALSQITVSARYVHSRLSGSILARGRRVPARPARRVDPPDPAGHGPPDRPPGRGSGVVHPRHAAPAHPPAGRLPPGRRGAGRHPGRHADAAAAPRGRRVVGERHPARRSPGPVRPRRPPDPAAPQQGDGHVGAGGQASRHGAGGLRPRGDGGPARRGDRPRGDADRDAARRHGGGGRRIGARGVVRSPRSSVRAWTTPSPWRGSSTPGSGARAPTSRTSRT